MVQAGPLIKILLVLSGVLWMACANADPIKILVTDRDLRQFHLLVGEREINGIRNYGGPHSNREAVELVLLHQALHAGGYDGEIELIPENNYSRIIRLIESGKATVAGTSVWSYDLKDSDALWVTDAVIRNGEFAVGVYVRPDNHRALQARTLADYAELSAFSNRHWPVDWRTLEAMHPNRLYHINSMELMVKMVGAGRGDFMLAPFSNREDLAIVEKDAHLVPVPGVKVVLKDSRHWIISKDDPMGRQVFQALQSGLGQLRQKGLIEQAYRQSGFFNARVANWSIVNSGPWDMAPAGQETALPTLKDALPLLPTP